MKIPARLTKKWLSARSIPELRVLQELLFMATKGPKSLTTQSYGRYQMASAELRLRRARNRR